MWDFSALKFLFYQQKTNSVEYLFRIQLSIYNEFLFIIIIIIFFFFFFFFFIFIFFFFFFFFFFANIDNG